MNGHLGLKRSVVTAEHEASFATRLILPKLFTNDRFDTQRRTHPNDRLQAAIAPLLTGASSS
jgi:hypothetical protein